MRVRVWEGGRGGGESARVHLVRCDEARQGTHYPRTRILGGELDR